MSKLRKGFTLIELLVVIGILGILLAIVLIAINPARQFALSNNTKRTADVSTILNAISQYMVTSKGVAPTGLDATAKTIASGGAAGTIDLCTDILVPKYISQLPYEPSDADTYGFTDCTDYNTGYTASVDADGRVTVTAPIVSEVDNDTPTISVTR